MITIPKGWKVRAIRINDNCLKEITPGTTQYNPTLSFAAVNCTYILEREWQEPSIETTFEQFSTCYTPKEGTKIFVKDVNKHFRYSTALKAWEEVK